MTASRISERLLPAALAAVLLLCSPLSEGLAAKAPLKVGDAAPGVVLADMKGAATRVPGDLRGQVVVLHFWAGGCSSCREEMPAMERLYDRYRKKGLAIVAINVGQKKEVVKKWVEDLRVSYPVLIDTRKEMAEMYDVVGLPRTYLVDRKGLIRYKILGSASEEMLQKQLLSLF